MTEPLDLDNLYNFLEQNATNYKYHSEIAQLFQKVRDKMRDEKKTDLETIAQLEIDVLHFSFKQNVANSSFSLPDKDGKIVNYPDYKSFAPKTYDYIIKRFESTNNPVLKAQYAHFLWFSPKRHIKYAQTAIDSYLILIKLYEEKDKQNPQNFFGFDVLRAIENAFLLSKNINDQSRTDITKLEINRLFFKFNPESKCLFKIRANLLELMIKEKAIFRKDDFSDITKNCFDFSKSLGDSHQAIRILELGEKVEQKTGTTEYNWNELIAGTYEKIMNANLLQDNKLAAIHFCGFALEYYKRSNNTEKIQKIEKIYVELSQNIEFPKSEFAVDLTAYNADCKKIIVNIMKLPPEQIIGYIMTDKNLPGYNYVKDYTQKILAQYPLLATTPVTQFDAQGHAVQHFSTEEEIKHNCILQHYNMFIEPYCVFFLNQIFIEGMKENKITYGTLIDFFQKHSWFGKTIFKKIHNKEIPYNWLNLLAPSLFEYFTQINYCMVSEKYPNLILCIDSLILKIEGLLRDLCSFKDIATFTSKSVDRKNGKRVFYEKELNALLNTKRINELFDPDELLLFKFVLIEKAGYNLRHKIAHSLMLDTEYSIDYANLLLLILLKIGRHSF